MAGDDETAVSDMAVAGHDETAVSDLAVTGGDGGGQKRSTSRQGVLYGTGA